MKINVTRNLRKAIKQGHPWIYKEAIETPTKAVSKAQFCQLFDAKGELGWGYFDPHGPLAVRVLSTERAPPGKNLWSARFERAHSLRRPLSEQATTAYRLFNGEGDLLPGLVCDVYADVAVLQFDGRGPGEFWDRTMIAAWILENTACTTVVEKFRRSQSEGGVVVLDGRTREDLGGISVTENGAVFIVNIEKGQKTGFFLDQRDNRLFVRSRSRGKNVLNLFSYTGGFSVYAGLGGAAHVTSVDISEGAVQAAHDNWLANGLAPANHAARAADVFSFLSETDARWDHIIVDPPSMTHSEVQKQTAKMKYAEGFAHAARKVSKGGELSLSSCSSHIDFDDFFEIISESLSESRRTGRILRVSGQGMDHPFPHSCHELRYLKFVHLVLD